MSTPTAVREEVQHKVRKVDRDRSDCCVAPPVIGADVPKAAGGTSDLLLCGHHYGASKANLEAKGATFFTPMYECPN